MPGPTGYRVKVIDCDVSTDTLYQEADIPSGLDKSYPDPYQDASNEELLGDPRFHAQNAYAIIMRTLVRFEQALRDVVKAILDLRTKSDEVSETLIDSKWLTELELKRSALLGLAEEMGDDLSGVRGSALRRSVLLDPATDNADSSEFVEEHRRGELLVAAMLNAFVEI